MLEFFVIGSVAAVASLLTFFSGFGLGTLLTPAFLIFFPVEVAVALTAIVHLLNNLFKMALIGRNVSFKVLVPFGITAIPAAFLGASVLFLMVDQTPVYSWSMGSKSFSITWANVCIGLIMAFFAVVDSGVLLKSFQIPPKYLWIGGLISGFFGGLSGHQGALRSAFLIKCGLSKEAFIATGIWIATAIDFSRLSIYFSELPGLDIAENLPILLTAVCSAFIGAIAGRQLLKKTTIELVQRVVSIMILILSLSLIFGLI